MKTSLLTLERAVHKMSGMPAKRVGQRDRGLLREGMFADIAIFDPQRVIDRATFEDSNQYPEGVFYVIVNGQLSVDEGKRTPTLAGRGQFVGQAIGSKRSGPLSHRTGNLPILVFGPGFQSFSLNVSL